MISLRLTTCVVALIVALGACGSSSEPVVEPAVEPTTAPAADPEAGNDVPGTDAAPTEADDGCAAGDAVTEDPWRGVEEASSDPGFAQIVEVIRQRTAHMTEPSSDSCTGFAVVDRGLIAADFGALAVRTYEHVDPYVRFDVFVYESPAALTAADAFATVETLLPAELSADNEYLLVGGQGQSVVVARSHAIGDNGFPPNEVGWIADDYGQRIVGFE